MCIGWNTTHYFLSGRKCFSIIPVLPYHLLLLRLFLELNFFTPFMGKARWSLYLFNSSCLQLQGLQATGGISWRLYMYILQLPKQSTAWFYCCYFFVCSHVIIRLLSWVTTSLHLVKFTNPTLNKASKKHVINNVSDIIQSHWANDPSLWAALNILLLNISMPVGLWCFAEDDRKTVSAHWGLRG